MVQDRFFDVVVKICHFYQGNHHEKCAKNISLSSKSAVGSGPVCPPRRNTLRFLLMSGESVMPAMSGHAGAPTDLIVTRFEELQRTGAVYRELQTAPHSGGGDTLRFGGECLLTESRWLNDLENFLCLLHGAGQVSYEVVIILLPLVMDHIRAAREECFAVHIVHICTREIDPVLFTLPQTDLILALIKFFDRGRIVFPNCQYP